jgi:hypothetical protein
MANFTQEGSGYLLGLITEGTALIATDQTWIGLTNSAPTATSTLATLAAGEAAVGGGGRKLVTSANWSNTGGVASMSSAVTWGTGVTLSGATHWFLCTSASGTSGKVICWGALSATRTLTTADTLTEQITSLSIA